jgi:plastocyanin
MKKLCLFALGGVLLVLTLSVAIAQEAQKVTIVLTNFKLDPSEITVKPGKVEFTLVNKGDIRHNLRLKMGDKDLKLVAGEYDMSCSSTEGGGSHREKGMVGKLIVK